MNWDDFEGKDQGRTRRFQKKRSKNTSDRNSNSLRKHQPYDRAKEKNKFLRDYLEEDDYNDEDLDNDSGE